MSHAILVGYARVSTKEQSLDIQIEELKKQGCKKIFSDKASGGDMMREGLNKMLEYVRDGDTVICMKTDRIARDTIHALQIAKQLKDKEVAFKLMDLGDVDLNSTMGQVIFTIISALAQAEKERINERCALGRTAAIERGVHMGRKKEIDDAKIIALKAAGKGATAIAKELEISRASVYRAIG